MGRAYFGASYPGHFATFASNECKVGTLPGSMAFMAITMPQVPSRTRHVYGENRQCQSVHIHAMALGNGKSYLTRLHDIFSCCTLEDSTSDKQAYSWPTTLGTRIIASVSVTVQMKPARFTPLHNTIRRTLRRCDPLLHPSMTFCCKAGHCRKSRYNYHWFLFLLPMKMTSLWQTHQSGRPLQPRPGILP